MKFTLSISDEKGEIASIGPGGVLDPPNSRGDIFTRQDGWIRFVLDSRGLPDAGAPFALRVTYTGTKGL
jgi:hypothetical protein